MAKMISMTRAEVEEAFSREGMLAPIVEELREVVEETHPQIFEFAIRVNRVSMSVWVAHSGDAGGLTDIAPITLAIRLMARCLDGFAACVVLARRGMTPEVGTLARSIYESAFWIGYFGADPDKAVHDYETDHLDGERGLAEAFQEMLVAGRHDDQIERIRSRLGPVKETLRSRKKIGVKKIAESGGLDAQFVYYKILCGIAAHSSKKAIDHYVTKMDDGLCAIQVGVDEKGVGKMLLFACHALMVATFAFITLTNDEGTDFQKNWDELVSLMNDSGLQDHVD